MKVIDIQGEIGWDVWAQAVRDSLTEVSSEKEITVRFSSIGGDIFEGADIFAALSDFKKDNPMIKMNLEIKGIAASMGSFISSSPVWDSVAVEEVTGFMVHNPYTFSFGDYREMKSTGEFLERATAAYSNAYASRSGKSIPEIRDMMDKTTWFFGQDIVDAGFADKVLESADGKEQKDTSSMMMRYKKTVFEYEG